jgi:predicted dithiol-disulfide oxidoreductase (DUF899 family)
VTATPTVVDRDTWMQARRSLLTEEKALTSQLDRLAEQRRALPWVKIDKTYTFDTPDGEQSLEELFGDRSQLDAINAYQARMGWDFRWVSSARTEFNLDFGGSFPEGRRTDSDFDYDATGEPTDEATGVSVFVRNSTGDVFHTYSAYGQG